jgi:signal transduction histidine kinase
MGASLGREFANERPMSDPIRQSATEVPPSTQRMRQLEAELDARKQTEAALAKLVEAERRARHDAERRAASSQASFDREQAARASAEALLAVVSHDLRTPLSAILLGTSGLLALPIDDEDKYGLRKSAECMQRSARHMARLIEDLVDFANMQAGRFALEKVQTTAAAVLNATLDLCAATARERQLELRLRMPDSLPCLECDPQRIVQVLANLVENAIKASQPAGQITLGAELQPDALLLFVSDTGRGLEPEDLARVFERYWRGARAGYRGSGLGLAIAKGIVEAHGGTIWADSRLGVGSRFAFSVPLSRR